MSKQKEEPQEMESPHSVVVAITLAIAKFAGYKKYSYGKEEPYWFRQIDKVEIHWGALPNFFKDLNAIHLAETYLSDKQKAKYNQILLAMLGAENLVFATAKQKVEALIKVI